MGTTIHCLPEELREACCKYADQATLRALRLTSRTLRDSATRYLFSHVEVQPTEASGIRCQSIMASPVLNTLVTSIAFNTSLHPLIDDSTSGDIENYWEETRLPLSFNSALWHIGVLQNVQSAAVNFARECVFDDGSGNANREVPETLPFRKRVLKMFFGALNHSLHPAMKVTAVSIKNLQDKITDDLKESTDFQETRHRLKSLSLLIQTEVEDAAPEFNLHKNKAHDFFEHELKSDILVPMQNKLTHLQLYCDRIKWGYYPFCDVRGLHFPKLQSLALGKFSFVFDWQLDWILSHGSTLRTLVLDDCPILQCGKADKPNHQDPSHEPDNIKWSSEDDLVWMYRGRWHDYFQRMREGLSELTHFVMGVGEWDEQKGCEEYMQLRIELRADRYGVFMESYFEEPDASGKYETPEGAEWKPKRIPDCEEEDRAALKHLLQAVEQRYSYACCSEEFVGGIKFGPPTSIWI